MWWDELNNVDYAPVGHATSEKRPKFYFNSITSRRPILNAITGDAYYSLKDKKKIPFCMGSRDEGRFFVVLMGEPDNPKESCKLFFDSPEQYENFTGNHPTPASKTAFQERKEAFNMVRRYELRDTVF